MTSLGRLTGTVAIAAVALLQQAPAAAQAQTVDFDIPAQDLGTALRAFARVTRQQVSFTGDAVRGKRSAQLKGHYPVRPALDALLANSGLVATVGTTGVFVVRAPAPGAGASAEAGAPAAPLALGGAADGSDIVVTATKREARLSDVPLPVQAVTASTLQKLGARNFSDYAHTLAGLQLVDAGTGRDQIFMRGVAAPQGYIGMQSAVGIYLDEIPISEGASQPDLNLYDVDRVEVLRGPQGTLYGSASLGGTIRIVTNKPDPSRFSAYVDADLSGTSHGGANGAYTATLNVPLLADVAAVRAVGYGRNLSGFIANPLTGERKVNDENTYGGRLSLRVRPVDRLTVDLTATHQQTKQGAFNQVDTAGDSAGTLEQFRHFSEPYRDRSTVANATIRYAGSDVEIVSASSLNRRRRIVANDFTGLNLLGNLATIPSSQTYRTASFTQEFRISSTGEHLISWLLGGYYSRVKNRFFQSVDVLGAGAALGLPDDNVGTLQQTAATRELAGFGEISIRPLEGLTATAGLRYEHVTLNASSRRSGLLFGGVLTDGADQAQHALIPKFNLSYKLSRDLLVYAQATKGFRIGGLNVTFSDTGDGFVFPRAYGADSLWNYEVGFKGTAFDGVLGFDVDAFLVDWKNIQLDLQHEGFDYFTNAGDARSKGFEGQLTLRLTRELHAGGQLTYTDSKLTKGAPGVGLRGDRVPYVPRVSAAGFLEYQTVVPGVGPSFARVDVQRVGRSYTGFGSTESPAIGGSDNYVYGDYTLTNLRVGTTIAGANVALYAKNVFDKRAKLLAGAYAAGVPTLTTSFTVARPRTIGIEVSRSF